MGPIGSKLAKVETLITDSIYVVLNMLTMTRARKIAFENLKDDSNDFVRGFHLKAELNPENNTIYLFNKFSLRGGVHLGKMVYFFN